MRRISIFLYHIGILLLLTSPVQAARRALLIGAGDYLGCNAGKKAGEAKLSRKITNLEGPTNDVLAMSDFLRRIYGFTQIVVLSKCEATRENILHAYREVLIKDASSGDLGVFYFSGHGSQVRNRSPQARREEPDGLDETIVPIDAPSGAPDIRDKELAELFQQSLRKGVLLTALFDSCHSGSMARGEAALTVRSVEPDPRPHPGLPPISGRPVYEEGALIYSAALSDQSAIENEVSKGLVHGLFTHALLRVLQGSPDAAAGDVLLGTRELLRSFRTPQVPVLQANQDRLRRTLFGTGPGRGAAARVAVRGIAPDGTVDLDGGLAIGLYAGAELRKATDGGAAVRLRVERSEQLASSTARLVSGGVQELRVGDVFQVTRWALPHTASVRVYLGRETELLPRLSQRLGQGTLGSSVAVVPTVAEADYLLAHRRSSEGAEYAWVMPGGSPLSLLPAATRWVSGSNPESASDELADLALRLGKIRAWLQLRPPPGEGFFPYELSLRNEQTGDLKGLPAAPDAAERIDRLHEGERYQVILRRRPASINPVERRYVYLLNLNRDGKLTLLYPPRGSSAGNEENRLPHDQGNSQEVPDSLPLAGGQAIFRVNCGSAETAGKRFTCGMETYILLSTQEPLLRPDLLTQEGVARDATPPQLDPLGQLLYGLGAAARGGRPPPPVPGGWSISRITVMSEP